MEEHGAFDLLHGGREGLVGGADDAGGMVLCAREGATPVPEEVAVEHVARHPLAVVRNEGLVGASGMVVNGAREQFLASAGLAPINR